MFIFSGASPSGVRAENKFWELFQYYLNGSVIQSKTQKNKMVWEVGLKKKINMNIVKSVVQKWISGGYGNARYIKPNQFATYGTIMFEEK